MALRAERRLLRLTKYNSVLMRGRQQQRAPEADGTSLNITNEHFVIQLMNEYQMKVLLVALLNVRSHHMTLLGRQSLPNCLYIAYD